MPFWIRVLIYDWICRFKRHTLNRVGVCTRCGFIIEWNPKVKLNSWSRRGNVN